MLAGDTERLRSLWDDDYIVNNPFNVVVTRSQVLEMVQGGQIAYTSFERTVEATRVTGDVAVTMGHEVVVPKGETDPVTRRYTHVWLRGGGAWQLVARHASVASG